MVSTLLRKGLAENDVLSFHIYHPNLTWKAGNAYITTDGDVRGVIRGRELYEQIITT
jgi:hypothetical protein